MRPLAEFIVSGRRQAIIVAVLGVCTIYFYWLGAAAVGLVTLRKGWQEGVLVLLWASLPAAGWMWFNEIMPMATLLGTAMAAALLRWTVSWRPALIAVVVVGFITSTVLLTLLTDYVDAYAEAYNGFILEIQNELTKQGNNQNVMLAGFKIDSVLVAGVFGIVQAMTTVISIVIARWWQATLYNPGGFQKEFHGLRMSPQLALALLAVMAVFFAAGGGYRVWATIACVPLLVCGIALMHGVVAIRRISSRWLVMFYVLLILIDGMKLFVAALAVLDSFLDYRKRLLRNRGDRD